MPALPVLDYLINKDYIAKNLCVNKDKPKSCCKGKCHLVKQLNKTSGSDKSESQKMPKQVRTRAFEEFLISRCEIAYPPQYKPLIFNIFCNQYHSKYYSRFFIPPENFV
jgi:hypothetical protein